MSSVVYLDYNATTPVLKETISELVSVMAEDFGNPASKTHRFGWKAAEKGFTHFISAGGDGTLHEVVNGLMESTTSAPFTVGLS